MGWCKGRRAFRRGGNQVATTVATIAATVPLAAQAAESSALSPGGIRAAEIADLWWIMLLLGTVIYLLVAVILILALVRRGANEDEESDNTGLLSDERRFIVYGGIVLPVIVLGFVLGISLQTMSTLSAPSDDPDITIEVIGHQWWWEVRYPDQGIVTANEIHIPAGQPVELRLTSADVIHSFWVPSLSGKLDLLPGRTNTNWIEADEPGIYHGQCAEFCGLQHAKMLFQVVVEEPAEYAAWVEQMQRPAPKPTDPQLLQGQQIFLGSACVYCHRIDGTNATGTLGPDLTHLASRNTLGAGILENNRANLAAWIVNSQHFKRGNKMPPMDLTGAELQALLDYLMSLE